MGVQDRSRALAEQAFDDMTRALGRRHPWTLGCALNAAAAALAGDHERAFAISTDIAHGSADVLGPRHQPALSARIALAADLRATGDPEGARRRQQDVLGRLAATPGTGHPGTLAARNRERRHWDLEPLTT
ncbi:tetratricopeptide repeat protein [Streptomyces sp. NPDC058470]|uniref:tetratricopeptide repeat protein n=1 Tax=Streptomyces sp. NPDC058470 TaxID=3346515 RepID=UPI00365F3C34